MATSDEFNGSSADPQHIYRVKPLKTKFRVKHLKTNFRYLKKNMSNNEDADFCMEKPMNKGEIRTFEIDFTKEAGRLNTSVSSADWTTDNTSTISLGTQTLTSNVASCPITASQEGKALVKVAATLANGGKIIPDLCIEVVDRERCW